MKLNAINVYIFIFSVFVYEYVVESKPSERLINERELLRTLLDNYERSIRPNDVVDVNVTVSLKQIDSIEDKEQIMISSCHISQSWFDPRLEWEPQKYYGIKTIMIDARKIWMPDTFVLNTADHDGYLRPNDRFSLASLHYDGNVYIIIPVVSLKTRCDLNTRVFPFDRQTCQIIFTGWSHPSNRIHYRETTDDLDLSDYIENPVWKLEKWNVSVQNEDNRVPFEKSKNTNIVINLMLRRKPLFFITNNVFAFLLLNILTLFLFFLPFSDQVNLSITIFLTFAVFMGSIANQIPEQSEYIAHVTYYSLASLLLNVITMIWFIVKYNIRKSRRIPQCFFKFAKYLSKLKQGILRACFCKKHLNRKISKDDEDEALNGGSKQIIDKEKEKEFKDMIDGLNFLVFLIAFIFVIALILAYFLSGIYAY